MTLPLIHRFQPGLIFICFLVLSPGRQVSLPDEGEPGLVQTCPAHHRRVSQIYGAAFQLLPFCISRFACFLLLLLAFSLIG